MPKDLKKAARAATNWKTDPKYRSASRKRKRRWYAKHRNTPELKNKYHEYYKNRFERHRTNQLRRNYNLTPDEFARLWESQNKCCAICGIPVPTTKEACIDHNHSTKLVRGILCKKCNFGIGYFDDDPAKLLSGAKYLKDTDG